MSLLLDDTVVTFAKDLKARYRVGLPVMAPVDDERPLRPEEVVNRDLDLGPYENPIVLTLIAAKDPQPSTALAASSRLLSHSTGGQLAKILPAMATLARDISHHEEVRTGMHLAVRHDFNPVVADKIGRLALRRVDDERQRAMEDLIALIKRLKAGAPVPETFTADLLRLAFAANVRPDMMHAMVNSIVASPVLRTKVRSSLLQNLHLFPRHLLLSVATQVNQMRKDPEYALLKRELEMALTVRDHMHRNGRLRPQLSRDPVRVMHVSAARAI